MEWSCLTVFSGSKESLIYERYRAEQNYALFICSLWGCEIVWRANLGFRFIVPRLLLICQLWGKYQTGAAKAAG